MRAALLIVALCAAAFAVFYALMWPKIVARLLGF